MSSRPTFLSASALPYTTVTVPSCAIVTNESGREVLRFRISVAINPPPFSSERRAQQHDGGGPLTSNRSEWKVDKLFSDFLALDLSVRKKLSGGNRKEAKVRGIVSLPEAKAFKGVEMGKVDQRKNLLEAYLQSILHARLPEKDDFCYFLSTNVVSPSSEREPCALAKEGYLARRGNKMTKWKKRYIVLGSLGRPTMDYFDGVRNPFLILISHALPLMLFGQRADTQFLCFL
jgi:RalA-binding protein 1